MVVKIEQKNTGKYFKNSIIDLLRGYFKIHKNGVKLRGRAEWQINFLFDISGRKPIMNFMERII